MSTISFRDPSGRLLDIDGRIIRVVNKAGEADLRSFLTSATSKRFVDSSQLIRTDLLKPESLDRLFAQDELRDVLVDADHHLVLEHERISFQSFPYEWPPEMLHAAGSLTLDLAESLLKEGLGLKDATPYNVLFRGPEAVFVDVLSVERREQNDPTWLPEAQFLRTFLLPLLVSKYFNLGLDVTLTTHRDGLEPQDVYRLCGAFQKFRPPFLTLASIPKWLSSGSESNQSTQYQRKHVDNSEKAQFILKMLLKRLRRSLHKVAPQPGRNSAWSDYACPGSNASESYLQQKRDFVEEALAEFKPRRVIDIGCNTGNYSVAAARQEARVVAIDQDPIVIGDLWRKAHAERLNILPLVVDISRPSPSTGWRNKECPSFLDRARGKFEALLMLAVIHHMLVTERIPLPEILDLAAELTTDLLIIEFVAPEDPMFRRITRGRDQLHKDLTRELFEETSRRRFELLRSQRLAEEHRWLYLLRKKG